MTTNKQDPTSGKGLGPGTGAQGRLTDAPPMGRTVVGDPDPPYDVVGTDALSPLLARVSFPATKDEVARQVGEALVPIDKWTLKPVAEILAEVAPTRFQSSKELEEAVQSRWDDIAEREGRGGRQPQEDYTSERPRRE